MFDTIKYNQGISINDYMWVLTIPQIEIMQSDSTHTEYLKVKDNKNEKSQSQKDIDFANQIPIV